MEKVVKSNILYEGVVLDDAITIRYTKEPDGYIYIGSLLLDQDRHFISSYLTTP